MALVALFTFTTPFLRIGNGNFAGNAQRRANGRPTLAPGQAPAQGGSDQGGGFGGGQGAGGFGTGQGTGGFGAGTARTGGNFALFSLIQPIRIVEAVIGGLFALIAAVGLLQRKKWGMVLAVIAAIVVLLTTGVTSLLPLLFRSAARGAAAAGARAAANPFAIWLTLLTRPTWESVILVVATVAVVVLALLPASRKAYVATPKVRRVV